MAGLRTTSLVLTRAYSAYVEPRSACAMPNTSSPVTKIESLGVPATMPERSWPVIIYGLAYVSGHISWSRIMVVAFILIRRWRGGLGLGLGLGFCRFRGLLIGLGLLWNMGGRMVKGGLGLLAF